MAVVTSFRSAGSLLVFGLLVGPPSTALLFVRQVWAGMVASVLVGWSAVGLGLFLAHHLETAVGATVAGTAVGAFFVALVLRSAVTMVRQPA